MPRRPLVTNIECDESELDLLLLATEELLGAEWWGHDPADRFALTGLRGRLQDGVVRIRRKRARIEAGTETEIHIHTQPTQREPF